MFCRDGVLIGHRPRGPERHYPSIDSARDSMGRDGRHSPKLFWISTNGMEGVPRLNVGYTVTFELEATDPRRRELVWKRYSLIQVLTPSHVIDGQFVAIDETRGSEPR